MEIPSPTLPADHPDRGDECEVAMENTIAELRKTFEDAGWTRDEFERALLSVAKRNAPAGD
jgi:hypothetical protein